jgi:hypothetical protein
MISCWNTLIGFRWPARRLRQSQGSGMKHLWKNGGNLGKSNDNQWFRLIYTRGSDFLSILNLVQAEHFRALIWGLSPFQCREPFPRPNKCHSKGHRIIIPLPAQRLREKCQTHLQPLTASCFPATRLNSSQRSCDPSWSILRNHYH